MKSLINYTYRNVSALMLLFFTFPLFAQQSEVSYEQQDSIVRQTTFHYAKDQETWFEKMNGLEIFQLVLWVKENSDAQVKIQGWADPIGTEALNDRISEGRARTAKEYLVKEGISASRIIFEGMGIDFESDSTQARRADLMAYLPIMVPVEKSPAPVEEVKEEAPLAETPIEEDSQEEELAPVAEQPAETEAVAVEAAPVDDAPRTKDELSLRTNLAYWLGSLINVGAEWNMGETPIGIVLNGGYAPFGSDSWKYSATGCGLSPQRCATT